MVVEVKGEKVGLRVFEVKESMVGNGSESKGEICLPYLSRQKEEEDEDDDSFTFSLGQWN